MTALAPPCWRRRARRDERPRAAAAPAWQSSRPDPAPRRPPGAANAPRPWRRALESLVRRLAPALTCARVASLVAQLAQPGAARAAEAAPVAVVVDDQVALRAAPRAGSPVQAQLWRGDLLEVRGEAPGFLKVYDHRRERPGWVRPASVSVHVVAPASAPALQTLALFLRDQAGAESLGIAYAQLARAAWGAAAPAGQSPLDDALGTMADRLARRASQRWGTPDERLAAHLEVARARGVKLLPVERDGRVQLCSDGEAEARALQGGDPAEQARAALLLTQGRCGDPTAVPARVLEWNEWRLGVLARVDPAAVAAGLQARVRLRRAEVLSWLAPERLRRAEPERARAAAEEAEALRELLLVDRAVLAEEEQAGYEEAAVRVSASRWAAEPARGALEEELAGRPSLQVGGDAAGQTCVRLLAPPPAAGAAGEARRVLFERCTFALVWPGSARLSPRGDALVLVAQPLPSWSELWLLRKSGQRWRLDVLPPAPVDPGVGAVEVAGFTPDGKQLLLAREAMVQGRLQRRFQVLRLASLRVEAQGERAEDVRAFRRFAAAEWRGRSLALR